LVAVLTAGLWGAKQFAPLVERLPRDWIIGSVLLAMALPLRIDTLWTTLRRPGPACLAVTINLAVLPPLAWIVSRGLADDLAVGVIVAATVPCTLASAAVWTRRAGGNDATSLLVTMATNLSCFLVTPAWLLFLAGRSTTAMRFDDMVLKLLLLIVLPIVLAQLLRTISAVGRWATANKTGLGVYAQLGILTMVLIAAVHGGRTLDSLHEQLALWIGQIVLMLALVGLLHTIAWWIGYWSAGKLDLAREEQIAVAFAGSQKTLTVGLVVALQFGGLVVLPMLAYHVEQLLIDTLLADQLRVSKRSAPS